MRIEPQRISKRPVKCRLTLKFSRKFNHIRLPNSTLTPFHKGFSLSLHHHEPGVTDSSDKQFKLLARVRPRYSSWYHWRGTATFKANRKDWNVDFSGKYTSQDKDVSTNFSEKGWAGCTFTIPAPDRSTWGVISLKNASSYTMRSVKIYAKGKENEAPMAEIPNTYASQELAKTAVLEGTYTITFEFINPNNNQVISKGVLNDIKVKMGRTQDAATTSLSTGDAKLQ